MTRIAENQIALGILHDITLNKDRVEQFSQEVSTGIKVNVPGDSNAAAQIGGYQETLRRVEGYQTRIGNIQSFLSFQDDNLNDVTNVMTRAKELATQGANETNTVDSRLAMAKEVFELRDHLVAIANSQYQGKYIYGGSDDDDPPFDAATYTAPTTGQASQRYVFDTDLGQSTTRSVNITDSLAVTTNTPGNTVFLNSINGLERLGRALQGYSTGPASGIPDGTGATYTTSQQQTQDISHSIDLLNTAVSNDISPERASIAGRLRRLDTAVSILKATQTDGEQVLGRLQKADISESASNLAQAQTALQASYTVSARVLRMSILDYL